MILTDVTVANVSYICLGGFVVLFSMVSLLLKERLYLGECVLAIVFGIAIGPYGADIFDPRSWGATHEITLEVMRIALAAGVFAIGIELPKSYLAKHWLSLTVLIVPTMAIGWVATGGLLIALFPKLTFVSALVISATLTPTDPILASAIMFGKYAVKHVPKRLRLLLAAESAANDGLAYPFLSLSLYLLLEKNARDAVGKWFLIGCLYQVILGTVLGIFIGWGFREALRFAQKRGYIDRESFVAQYLALAVFCAGVSNMLGSDDLLTAFAAGSAVSWDGEFNVQTEDDTFAAVLDLVFNCATFIYIGAWVPFKTFVDADFGIAIWKLVVFSIGLLFLRRIPAVLALYKFVPDVYDWKEALFCGHFGPMGVGAVYISTIALLKLPHYQDPPHNQLEVLVGTIEPIVAFVVLSSIVVHGLSIFLFKLVQRVQSRVSLHYSRSKSAPPDWLQATKRQEDANAIHEVKGVETAEAQGVQPKDDDTSKITPPSNGARNSFEIQPTTELRPQERRVPRFVEPEH